MHSNFLYIDSMKQNNYCYKVISFLFTIIWCNILFSQYNLPTFTFPNSIYAMAGPDVTFYGDPVIIGGSPSAADGHGTVTYEWAPADGLNNASIANPSIISESNGVYILTVTDEWGCSASSTLKVTYNVGIENLDNNFLSLYPNPTTSMLNLKFEKTVSNAEVSLYSISGKCVFIKLLNMPGKLQQIDVSIYPRGAYYIKITTPLNSLTQAIFLQ
jgi:hypothetical protein